MALSIEALANALRIDNPEDPAIRGALDQWLNAAELAVNARAPLAPGPVMEGAVAKLAGYWFDQPTTARGSGFANAMTNSGAHHMLGPWIVRRVAGAAQADIDDLPNAKLLSILREEIGERLRGVLVWR